MVVVAGGRRQSVCVINDDEGGFIFITMRKIQKQLRAGSNYNITT